MSPELDEVRRLQAAYSYFADIQDGPALSGLFAADGALIVGDRDPVVGEAGLSAMIAGAPRGVHHAGPPHQEPDGTTHTAFTFFSTEPGRLASGYYRDEFTRGDDGRLLFQSRTIRMISVWPARTS